MSALRTFVTSRMRRWSARRSPVSDTLVLTQRNIYILPTRAGAMFALTLVVLLLASINYQLNLGYVLTFMLAGSGIVSMHVTHATLRGLSLRLAPTVPAFAGDGATLDVSLVADRRARVGVGLKIADAPASALAWIDVPAGAQSDVRLRMVAQRRGREPVPLLSIETRFPLGLFKAWSIWPAAGTVLVYPKPETPAAPLPATPVAPSGGAVSARQVDGGEADGVRSYRRGDSLNRVVWKKAARALETGGELVSRDTRSLATKELRLEWRQCGGLGPEERLSRLCAWVLAAERAGVDYALSIPGVELPVGHGDAHRRRALEALAEWR